MIETNALLEAINNGTISDAVIDVWEHEPEINRKLLEKVLIGTPHIAGYSADGKQMPPECRWTPSAVSST